MTTWITDDNGNRASVECWGSEDEARKALASLTDCHDCRDCRDCYGCYDCRSCRDCRNCGSSHGCHNCQSSHGCRSCQNCRSCYNCRSCHNCQSSSDCRSCQNCQGCHDCRSCQGCDLTLPHVHLPVSDPRPYTWLAIVEGEAWRIRAGCRNFSIAEARVHWLNPDYNGPKTVRETVGFALDWVGAKPVRVQR